MHGKGKDLLFEKLLEKDHQPLIDGRFAKTLSFAIQISSHMKTKIERAFKIAAHFNSQKAPFFFSLLNERQRKDILLEALQLGNRKLFLRMHKLNNRLLLSLTEREIVEALCKSGKEAGDLILSFVVDRFSNEQLTKLWKNAVERGIMGRVSMLAIILSERDSSLFITLLEESLPSIYAERTLRKALDFLLTDKSFLARIKKETIQKSIIVLLQKISDDTRSFLPHLVSQLDGTEEDFLFSFLTERSFLQIQIFLDMDPAIPLSLLNRIARYQMEKKRYNLLLTLFNKKSVTWIDKDLQNELILQAMKEAEEGVVNSLLRRVETISPYTFRTLKEVAAKRLAIPFLEKLHSFESQKRICCTFPHVEELQKVLSTLIASGRKIAQPKKEKEAADWLSKKLADIRATENELPQICAKLQSEYSKAFRWDPYNQVVSRNLQNLLEKLIVRFS